MEPGPQTTEELAAAIRVILDASGAVLGMGKKLPVVRDWVLVVGVEDAAGGTRPLPPHTEVFFPTTQAVYCTRGLITEADGLIEEDDAE